ncbi:hypothetical protein IWGMT90018_06580 [Mycobacterium kiyosense]|nr:hypothetical protein IWGMT90018_06580 [Mycobacterium kiyosense]
MTITVDYDEKIAVLDLGDDENRFSPEFLDDINARLDDIEAGDAQGLVTTATGKFYTNGLDLDWLGAHGEQTQWYVGRVQTPACADPDVADTDMRRDRGPCFRRGGNVGPGTRLSGNACRPRLLLLPRGRHQDPLHPPAWPRSSRPNSPRAQPSPR